MGKALDKLLSIASNGLWTERARRRLTPGDWDTSDLEDLLNRRNGFYAFESALHVLPWESDGVMDISRWNNAELWKAGYDGAADGLLCFAENAFGDQFCLSELGIIRFDPETTATSLMARRSRSGPQSFSKTTGGRRLGQWPMTGKLRTGRCPLASASYR